MRKKTISIEERGRIEDASYGKFHKLWQLKKMSRGVTVWLNELVSAYKERGEYPILPYLIGNFYKDDDDRAIAILMGCLFLSISQDKPERVVDTIKEFIALIGEHPYEEFYRGRKFVLLSTAGMRDKYIDSPLSISFIEVSKVINSLWETQEREAKPIKRIFQSLVASKNTSPTQALRQMIDTTYVKSTEYRLNLALLALCSTDGIGVGLWNFEGAERLLRVPCENDMEKFADMFCPEYKRYGLTIEDVGDALGLKKPVDMWYAYHAYRKLFVSEPTECARFARRYRTHFERGRYRRTDRWTLKQLLPPIV